MYVFTYIHTGNAYTHIYERLGFSYRFTFVYNLQFFSNMSFMNIFPMITVNQT